MSSTNPFTTDSEGEPEGPRPGPVSRLFGVTSRQDYTTSSKERLLPKGRLTFPSPSHVVHTQTIDYNPFSSSEEEEEEELRGRARQKSSRSQDKRRARLATSLTLLLVVFVLVTAVIMGLATSHSSQGGTTTAPVNTNTTYSTVSSHIGEGRGEVGESEELRDKQTGEGVEVENIEKSPDVGEEEEALEEEIIEKPSVDEEEDVGETNTEEENFDYETY